MKYPPLFLDKIRSGDQESFKILYHDLFASLVVYAKKYIDDDTQSEDLVQEVFVTLWNNISDLDIKISIKSYLYATVRNQSLNYLKKKASIDRKLGEHILLEMNSLDEYTILSQDVFSIIHKEIENLPKKAKKVMQLSLGNLSVSEIQEELDVSKNTVKTHRRRAYATLREKLKNVI